MPRAETPFLVSIRWLALWLFVAMAASPAGAAVEKQGMPDLSQVDQTCLPTATANLIIWFGEHGYPKLIVSGDNKDDGYIHTIHRLMEVSDARFDWGTRPDLAVIGVKKYIESCGYKCSVEFRGLAMPGFSQKWLDENDDSNKGFVLLLSYCTHDEARDTYANAWTAGHAVTLVNSLPGMLLVHDPAHEDDEPGRKILTTQELTHGTWVAKGGSAPVAGLMLVSGSLLDAPPGAKIIMMGAICITMHPPGEKASTSNPADAPSGPVGSKDTPPPPPPTTDAVSQGLLGWLLEWLLGK